MSAKIIEELSNKIKELYSSVPAEGMERNLNALLQGAFTKLELVSREEFEVQAEILRKTRAQLEKLEQELSALEAKAGIQA